MLPERLVPTKVTKASGSNAKSFRTKKCRTSTYQHSFFVRPSRTWNALPLQLRYENITLNQFKSLLSSYYKDALFSCFDIEDPRTWKSVCLKCNMPCNLSEPVTAIKSSDFILIVYSLMTFCVIGHDVVFVFCTRMRAYGMFFFWINVLRVKSFYSWCKMLVVIKKSSKCYPR